MRRLLALTALVLVVAACGSGPPSAQRPQVVVTFPVLGAVVREVVGDAADVTVLMPAGVDPHEWSPSARDVERVARADLVVENGLGLEAGLVDALDRARADGTAVFTAADHVTVRRVGAGEGADPSDPDQAPGAVDPHLWTDPLTMREVVLALGPALEAAGIAVGDRAQAVAADLERLDADVRGVLAPVAPERRVLVTGHESLGYFADRYGFRVVGTVVPGVSSQAEPSAKDLAALVRAVAAQHVPALFTEVGTPASVVRAVGDETGAKVVELSTHTLPRDGTYRSFLLDLAGRVAGALGS